MGYSYGFENGRDIGYGVPAWCDQPKCNEKIDRGLSYRCGDFHSDNGCGMFFCEKHLYGHTFIDRSIESVCKRCHGYLAPYPQKADHPEWIKWKLSHPSWKEWREKHPKTVQKLSKLLATQ